MTVYFEAAEHGVGSTMLGLTTTTLLRGAMMAEEKSCYRCEMVKPKSDFTWKRKPLGELHATCKECLKSLRAQRPQHPPAPLAEKRCTKCHLFKSIDYFSPRPATRDGWMSQCDQCRNDGCREHYWRNAERMRARARERNKINADWRRQYNKQYRENNAEYYITYNARWNRENLHRGRARRQRRRAAIQLATPVWADSDAILAVFAKAVELGMEVDHIVPLQSKTVCGLHVPWNLQLLTRAENTAKRNWHWPDMP